MNVNITDIQYRSLENEVQHNDRHISGYAIVFNAESRDLGGFTEVIDRSAVTEDLINSSDILALFNHDANRGLLARSNKGVGSLTLTVDDHGLRYEFDAPHTALGDEVLEYLTRGDIYGSSFGFRLDRGDSELIQRSDGTWLHHIHHFKTLLDVSPVIRPAYVQTDVYKRSIDEAEAEAKARAEAEEKARADAEAKARAEAEAEEKARRKAELDAYYKELKSKI